MVNFERKTGDGKKILPSTCRIGETIFTSMAIIGGKLYRNHPKNLNHVHKYTKYLVSVIITLGKNISGGDTVFYDGVKTSDLGSRAHILKHLHGRIIFGPFEKVFHEGTLWSEHDVLNSGFTETLLKVNRRRTKPPHEVLKTRANNKPPKYVSTY